MGRFFFISLLLLMASHGYAQHSVSGKIIDADTKFPIAFANIYFNNDASLHVFSDIDGKFTFTSSTVLKTLTCTHVGYNQKIQTISQDSITVEQILSTSKLNEVIVTKSANPANRIIQKVIENKPINNPENLPTFQYQSYNKVTYDFKSNNGNTKDSLKIRSALNGSHLFLMESQTERKFIAPDLSEEKVIATKVSGFKNPSFAALATDIQPFSFYKDAIRLLNIHYLNPIANSSLKKYKFKIEETVLHGKDTIFILSFKPLQNKNFDALQGLLYINSHKYAIQNIIAYPAEKGKIDLKIQQQYQLINNEYWFPEQLNYNLIANEYPSKNIGMLVNGKSYISEVSINPPLERKKFTPYHVYIAEQANKDNSFWDDKRKEPLTLTEQKTYIVLDSIGKKQNFDLYINALEKLTSNKLPIGFFDIDLSKTLVINKYESLRIGTGLYTNEKVFKNVSLGGFFGYGIKDEEWKYGGELLYSFKSDSNIGLGLRHQNNLLETGNSGIRLYNKNLYNFRTLLGYQFDNIVQNTLSVKFDAYRYLNCTLAVNQTAVKPLYQYEFNHIGNSIRNYNNTDISLFLRFAYKEQKIKSFGTTFSSATPYPVLYVYFSKGMKGALNGDFNYSKIEVAATHRFYTPNFGLTKFRIETGYIDQSLPIGLLFTGEGNNDDNLNFLAKDTFQSMNLYEFLSDRYAHLFLAHNFGRLLFKTKLFQPDIILHNNFGWGELSSTANHRFLNFKTKEKGYCETGLQLDNVVKLNVSNLGYLGLGLAGYYRYGYYALPDSNDNLVYKFTLSFSVK